MLGFKPDFRQSAKGVVLVDPKTSSSFDADNPLPIGSGPRTVFTGTISNGQSLSAAIDLGNYTAARIGLPATVTGSGTTSLTFQSSHDGVTWKDFYDQYGSEYKIASGVATQGRSYILPLSDFASHRFLKIRTGTSASPQAQGQDTAFVVTGVA